MFVLTHFILGIDPNQLVPASAYMVLENLKASTKEKTPLPIVRCTTVQYLFDELKINIRPGELLEHQYCVVFPKGSLIGWDKKQGIKRTV